MAPIGPGLFPGGGGGLMGPNHPMFGPGPGRQPMPMPGPGLPGRGRYASRVLVAACTLRAFYTMLVSLLWFV